MASTTLPTRALTAALFTLLAWAATPLTTQAQLPDYLPTEGLVGWWPFNGNANDESGNGNDGVVNGATLVEDRVGASNSAYDFDGVNDRISISHDTSLNTPLMSVSAWCNAEGYSSQGQGQAQFIICKEYDPQPRIWSLYAAPGNSGFGSELKINGSLLEFGAPFGFDLGSWVHATITYDGSQVRFYVNGELQVTYTSIGALDVTTQDLSIGYLPHNNLNAYGYFFNGLIDDIGIWNRALTQQEITALYTGQPVAAPCADPTACNFEQEGECVYAEPNLDCAGNCLNDCNNNGVCDEDEVFGCAYSFACNYNPEATTDDGTCTVALANYDCDGNCLLDLNNNGLCDLEEVAGCTNIDAINYNADATLDDGSCMVTCKGDFDNDGQITINDLLGFLAAFGNQCEGAGCMDPAGCNYDPTATFDLGYCEYPAEFFNCNGTPINDADGDGVPDELEVLGCTNAEACNYDALATDDNGSCELPAEFFNCDGTPVNDTDGDGVADELEVAGCTDPEACNYDVLATDDNGNCELPAEFFNCDGTPINDADGDGIPDELEVAGCTDPEAGNFNPEATDDNGSCTFGLTGATHTCGAENVHNPDLVYGSVTDIDGNTYRTIVIGNQEWMAENLTVEHYANGDPIPNVTNGGQWVGLTTGAWCYFENDPAYECPYGKLYNWYVTIDARNVCPTGWHVPTDAEWTILTGYLGGGAGGKMKSTGTQYWMNWNNAATNESGFSGLPGGFRNTNNGSFPSTGGNGYWWTSTQQSQYFAWNRWLYGFNGNVYREDYNKTNGMSVRCLRD